MNEFWSVLKGLEGRTVKEVRPHEYYSEEDGCVIENGLEVHCTDGYVVSVKVDYEDVELVLAEPTQS